MIYGELAGLSAALLWTFSSYVFTFAAQRMGTLMLNILRMFFASIFIIITLLIFTTPVMPTNYQLIMLTISGFLGLVIGDTFLFKAYTEIGPRVTSLIMATNPAMGAIMAYFVFTEVLSPFTIIGMLITLVGIGVVVLDKKKGSGTEFHVNKKGILYGFLGAVGQASGLIFAKYALQDAQEINFLMATLVRIFTATVMLIPITYFFRKFKNPIKMLSEDKKAFGLVILGSILGPYFGITLSFIAINYAPIGVASTLMSMVPIFILPVSKYVFKEDITIQAVIGAILGVAGVAILFLF